MRLIFTANPSVGHLVPVLTLARAARDAGHEVVVMTAGSMADLVAPLPLAAVGPSWEELSEENARRHPGKVGSVPQPLEPTPDDIADFFVRTRLELAADDVARRATEFAPDLVVADAADSLGPFIAATLHVPWAAHGFGTPVPAAFAEAMQAAAGEVYGSRGVEWVPRCAIFDPWPDVLHEDGYTPPADRITLCLETLAGEPAWEPPPSTAGRALVTFGTTVDAPDVLGAVVASLLEHTDLDLVVTRGVLASTGLADPRVTEVGFVPLADLLQATRVVVAAGGAGTVLGTMTAGQPIVLLPFFLDQHWHGAQITRHGAGAVVDDAAAVGPAVARVLASPAYAAAAQGLAREIAALNTPDRALRELFDRAW